MQHLMDISKRRLLYAGTIIQVVTWQRNISRAGQVDIIYQNSCPPTFSEDEPRFDRSGAPCSYIMAGWTGELRSWTCMLILDHNPDWKNPLIAKTWTFRG